MSESPEVPQKKKKNVVDKGLNELCFNFVVPVSFINAYKMAICMAKLFEPTAMGEIFRNMVFQIDRVFELYGFDAKEFPAEVAPLYTKYKKLVEEEQIRRLQELAAQGGTADEGANQG